VQAVSDLAINFGEGNEGTKRKPMSRPYGVGLLIGGVDQRGPQLYATDPSGTYCQWKANAIGSGQETALNTVKEQYHQAMTLDEAEKMIMQVLKNVMEDPISKDNVEIAIIPTATKRLEYRTPEQLEAKIATLA